MVESLTDVHGALGSSLCTLSEYIHMYIYTHNHTKARPKKQQPFPIFLCQLMQEGLQGRPAFPWAEEHTHPLSLYHDQHVVGHSQMALARG